ncbi:MAG: hypothetical protein ACTSV1_10055 [Alphaproteobacteria bacterium]
MFLRRMGKQGLKCRVGALAGLAALSVHLFLALAQFTPTKAMADAVAGMPSFMVICVVYGGASDDDTDKNRNGGVPSCPVCLAEVLAGGIVPAASADAVTFPEYARLSLILIADERTRDRHPLRRLSRAPPVFA